MRRVLIESGVEASPSRVRRYEFAVFKDSLSRCDKLGERLESPVSVSLQHALTHDFEKAPGTALIATDHAVHWLGGVDAVVLYIDLGMSPRMIALRDAAEKQNKPVELRTIEFQACE